MKKLNYPLILGGLLVFLFISAYFFPQWFTERDPMFEEPPRYVTVMEEGEEKQSFFMNPLPPNEENIMGTDDAGRDIYARLVYGTRNTLKLGFFIALVRLLLALPFGVLAGMGKKFFQRVILFFSTYFTAVPILILSFLIFRINFFRNMQLDRSIIFYGLILGFLGFARTAGVLQDAVKKIMEEDFIEGQIAVGKSWFQIVRQNIFPHLLPTLFTTFFKETAQGLFLLAQLSLFGIFVGTTREVAAFAFRANYEMSLEPEWGSMLVKLTSDLGGFYEQWWLVVYPVLVMTLAIMGMNLLGEGLRIEFQKRTSHFVSYVRKAYHVFSLRVNFLELKNFKQYKKRIFFKVASVSVVLTILLVPSYRPQGDFQVENAMMHLEELIQEKYHGRVSGSPGGYLAGEYIKETLTPLGFEFLEHEHRYVYRIQEGNEWVYDEVGPVVEKGEEKGYTLSEMTPLFVQEGELLLKTASGEEERYLLHEDFTLIEIPYLHYLPGDVITTSGTTFSGEELPVEGGIPVMELGINEAFGSFGHSYRFPGEELEQSLSLDIYVIHGQEGRVNTMATHSLKLLPFGQLRERLLQEPVDLTLTYTFPDFPKHSGRTIEAWLYPEGYEEGDQGEVFILGVPYDGVYMGEGEGSVEMTTPVAMALEIARAMTAGDKTYDKPILFLFYDNEQNPLAVDWLRGSNLFNMRQADIAKNGGYSYLELMGTGLKKNKDVDILAYFGQVDKKASFRSLLNLEGVLKKMKVPYTRYQGLLPTGDYMASRSILDTVTPSILSFRANGHLTVGIGDAHKNSVGSKEDVLNRVHKKKLQRVGTALTDLLISGENFRLFIEEE